MPAQPDEKKRCTAKTSNDNLVRLVDMLEAHPYTKSRADIAREIGVSPTTLNQVYRGVHPCSKLLSVAAEAILRRFNKANVDLGDKVVIARINPSHWPTINAFISGLKGRVLENFHALLAEGEEGDCLVIILKLHNTHIAALEQLVKITGGELKGIA